MSSPPPPSTPSTGVPLEASDELLHGSTVRVHLPTEIDSEASPRNEAAAVLPVTTTTNASDLAQPFVHVDASVPGATVAPQIPLAVPVNNVEPIEVEVERSVNKKSNHGHETTDQTAIVDVSKLKPTTSAFAPSSSHPAESPEVRANLLSRLTYWWLNGIVFQGAKRALMEEDMYEVNPDVDAKYLSDRFEKEWAIELEKMKASKKGGPDVKPYQASIPRAMYRIFWRDFWIGAASKASIDGLQFFQPILMEWMLGFIMDVHMPGDTTPDWHGYLYAMAIGINPIITTVLSNLHFRKMMVIGIRARTILTTQLYKKSLRLSPGARQNMSVGQIVNMMSTDASKIDLFSGFIHFLWSTLEQIIIAVALLIRAIGPSALAGVGIVLILIPVQGYVMTSLQQLRRATVKYTDGRVKLMNEILQGIRVLKVYAWEGSFLQKLMNIRLEEVRFIRSAAKMRAWNMTIMQASPILMSLLAFMTLALSSDTFDPKYIFSSLVLFNLLRMPLLLFPMALAFWSDARIGIQRITAFFLADELHSEPEYLDSAPFSVKVTHAKFAWEKVVHEAATKNLTAKEAAQGQAGAPTPAASSSTSQVVVPTGSDVTVAKSDEGVVPFNLDDVNFTIPKGSLTVIVGAVGAGKSSLLSGILGEMKRENGSVQICGSVGYCPQQAWIANSTLKENILFGKPFDQSQYDEAIKYCALQADIDVLPAGDQTEIGEKGINLSGGQVSH